MKIGSLFSGYGGLDLAVEAVTGAYPAWFCEFDPAPSKVLAYHWPDVPNHKDVTQIDWADVEPVDILTGGSPCQDLSQAGKRAGMTEGTRSNLWVNMREAINHLRPRLVVWENVLGALSAPAESESDAATSNLEQGGDYWQRPQEDIFGHSVAYSETLPKSGTTRNGQLYERPISAHPTTAPASSSSPGPVFSTPDTMPDAPNKGSNMKHQPAGLGNQVATLPTPRAMDTHGSMTAPAARKHVEAGYGTLPEVLGAQMFPTPKASDGVFGRPKTTGRPIEKAQHLQTIVTLLPTPKASEAQRSGTAPSEKERRSPTLAAVDVHFPTPNAADGIGGGCNPTARRKAGRQVTLRDAITEISNGENMPPLFGGGSES